MLKVATALTLIALTSSFPFPEECGINYIQPDNVGNATHRIVGGFEAVPGSWPWQAYLKFKGSFTCGGTLIHPEWMISAAHCFAHHTHNQDWEIVFGEHDDTIEEGWEQGIEPSLIIVHPDYDQHTIDNDFTLVKLSSPVTLNDHVAPACFPSETDDLTNTFPEGKDCIVSGWGSINPEGDVWGPVLKQDYAELWTNQNCETAYGEPGWITDQMICAGFHVTGSDDPERCMTTGYGDSGGPLVCRHPDTGRWTHIGAVSWGTDCQPDGYTPGVYANTISLRQWIVQMMEENM